MVQNPVRESTAPAANAMLNIFSASSTFMRHL
jgi:hypothetical protein